MAPSTTNRLAILIVTLWLTGAVAADPTTAGSLLPALPPWDEGLTAPPPGWAPGEPYLDPYADDEPLVVIGQDNMATWRDLLPTGLAALIERYPDTFAVPVYPTHRSHAVPSWVAENIQAHAETAQLTADGNGFTGARAGIPFPRPQSALEVYWNHIARWRGQHVVGRTDEVNVFPDGRYIVIGRETQVRFDYYLPDAGADNRLFSLLSRTTSPPRQAGGGALVLEPINQEVEERQAWSYDSGRRRVIRAPNLAFDSALPSADGLKTADDTDIINGSPSRYEWQLLGRRELIVPYNNYRINAADTTRDSLIMPGHLNPDFLRYERHGVYVIEGRLKPQWRHVYARRVIYVDEDSWTALIAELYDSSDDLWRVSINYPFNAYQLPGTLPAASVYHDLAAGRYHVQGIWTERPGPPDTSQPIPDDGLFTPSGLRRFVR